VASQVGRVERSETRHNDPNHAGKRVAEKRAPHGGIERNNREVDMTFQLRRSVLQYAFLAGCIFFFLTSCATTNTTPANPKVEVVDTGTFKVRSPAGLGWTLRVDDKKGEVIFEKHRTSWNGRVIGITTIRIFTNNVLEGIRQQWAAQQIVNEYFDLEIDTMKREGVDKGRYNLSDVNRDSLTVGTKDLFRMTYKTWRELNVGDALRGLPTPWASENALYLYFPPTWTTNHTFFMFLINEAYERGQLLTNVNLDQILPVIASFEQK